MSDIWGLVLKFVLKFGGWLLDKAKTDKASIANYIRFVDSLQSQSSMSVKAKKSYKQQITSIKKRLAK